MFLFSSTYLLIFAHKLHPRAWVYQQQELKNLRFKQKKCFCFLSAAYALLKKMDLLLDSNSPSTSVGESSQQSFKCPRCQRSYSLPCTLIRHIRYECGVDKQFACQVCGKRFARRDILKSHEAKLHPYFLV